MNRYLAFFLGESEYAVPLLRVRSVVELTAITPVPYMPPHFLGLINVRGDLITVIDPKKRLSIHSSSARPEPSVVILECGQNIRGIAVDSVNRVISVENEGQLGPLQLLDIESTLSTEAA